MFPGITTEIPELVQSLYFRGHDCLWNFLGNYLGILNRPLRTICSGTAYVEFGAGNLRSFQQDSSGSSWAAASVCRKLRWGGSPERLKSKEQKLAY
jgi:hypothetical protein